MYKNRGAFCSHKLISGSYMLRGMNKKPAYLLHMNEFLISQQQIPYN